MAKVLTLSLNPALDLAIRLQELTPGAVNRTESTRLDPAGKGVNVARVLVALDHEVTVSGFLGAANDAAFRRAFADLGVEDAFLRVPGETRINAKISEQDGRVTDINGPGMHIDREAFRRLVDDIDDRVADPARRPDAVVIAGSLPPGVSPEDLASLIRHLRKQRLPVWVDTSGPALAAAIAIQPEECKPNAIKPNELELAAWAGETLNNDAAWLRAAQRLHDSGIEEAMISAGGDGVLWVSRRGIWLAMPPRVSVVSTVGAGDTLLAAMLHGVLGDLPAEQALRLATALSAESVRHVGVGDPQAVDVDHLQQQTRVRHLNGADAKEARQ
ncbi:1-phosphofructokinase [Halomonas sp. GXIMD04776]|uniref:1-phosphofructokinase n=1 Tax=Halomonas sp. GXIMD04776 TaxID=3415605 RepID=UPI003C852ACD